jgi:hypothetical protein
MTALPLAVPTVRPAPRREPGYEAAREGDDPAVGVDRLDGQRQPCLPFARPRATAVRVGTGVSRRTPPTGGPASRAKPAGPTALAGLARALILAMLEVVAGRRPAAQLRRHVSPAVYAALAHPEHWPAPFRVTTRSPQVIGLHLSRPSRSGIEIAATVYLAGRIRAVAARLELRHDQWQCDALELL